MRCATSWPAKVSGEDLGGKSFDGLDLSLLRQSLLLSPLGVTAGKCARTGPTAGVTRTVQERVLVHLDPKVYVYDTPGIMPPNVEHVDTAMRLALCGLCNGLGGTQIPTHSVFKDYKICNLPHFSILNPLGALRDDLVGPEYIADYLLYTLNRRELWSYVDRYRLAEPTDHIQEFLQELAQNKGLLLKGLLAEQSPQQDTLQAM